MNLIRVLRHGLLIVVAYCGVVRGGEVASAKHTWHKLSGGAVLGQRTDIPLGYSPALKQFLILGGRTHFGEYRKPRSYDTLLLNQTSESWENVFPNGKSWGPIVGNCTAPAWKNESVGFLDVEGNVRPNWTIYGTFSLGSKYAYDPVNERFVFYLGGHTFSYHPGRREWTDHQPAIHPEGALGGILLWSSLCYDAENSRFILFGGGNVTSERGDPGTWAYIPELNEWKQLDVGQQPPPRANSQLAYDPLHQKIVLFGGDTLSSLLSDTWTFDVKRDVWENVQPKQQRSPSPRAGHALHWLPTARKFLLLGGYTYTSTTEYVASLYRALPLEAWTFDVETREWEFIEQFDSKTSPVPLANRTLSSAVSEEGTVVVLDQRNEAWLCRFDSVVSDLATTMTAGVTAETELQREKSHDPQWYQQDVPSPNPKGVVQELAELPANRWVLRPTPKRPEMNMDWGSAVLAPELDLIVRFSGGHSAYSGTAPQVYDLRTDRYSLPFPPEYPIEFVYSNDQVHGEWSFRGNPWMTGHTYKSTGYDRNLKCLVFVPHEFTYFFDPVVGKWSRGATRNPFRSNFYTNTVCTTPQGAVVWADKSNGQDGLWRLEGATRTWNELKLRNALPDKSADASGLAYDSQRDRLLCFSNVGKQPGDIMEYDLKSGETRWLNPTGKHRATVPSRETVYIPEWDLVLLAARTRINDSWYWLAYDCATNGWLGIEFSGVDPIGKGTSQGVFHNSVGLMYDPLRKLVWAVGQHSEVHVLRLEKTSANISRLE